MRFQRLIIFVCLLFSPLLAVAQYDRVAIDSMNTAIREYRHSVRQDIRDYRDSIRDVRSYSYDSVRHELRVGWGDQLFETLVWYNQPHSTLYLGKVYCERCMCRMHVCSCASDLAAIIQRLDGQNTADRRLACFNVKSYGGIG